MRLISTTLEARTRPILLVALVLSTSCAASTAEAPKSNSGSSPEWKTITTDWYALHFRRGGAADATLAMEMIDAILVALDAELGAQTVSAALTDADIKFYIYDRHGEKAVEGYSLLESGSRNGRYYGTIHLLGLSAHRPGGTTMVGEPFDRDYLHKTLTHELSTIMLDRMTRLKEKGWRYYSSPRWFAQGYPEYLGLMRASEHSRDVTLKMYLDRGRKNPDRAAGNDYLGGALRLLFLHERFGKEKVQAMLRSTQPTFWQAMRESLGLEAAAFESAWREWLSGEAA